MQALIVIARFKPLFFI